MMEVIKKVIRFFVIGVDIGGTKTAVSLCSNTGELFGHERIKMAGRDPKCVIPEVLLSCHALMRDRGISRSEVHAIGIASPAPLDIKAGLIQSPANLPNWVDVPIRDILQEKLGIRAYLENDANAGALAEWFFGAGQNCNNLVYLTMSTGIGGGIIAGGKLITGVSSMAGEIGHIVLDVNGPPCLCGLAGCYEAFAGGKAVTDRMKVELKSHHNSHIVKLAGSLDDINMHTLEKAVLDGDDYAISLWKEMCFRHAQATGVIMNILNPEKIILGTIAHATGKLFMDEFLPHLPRFCLEQNRCDCSVVLSGLGRQIGEYSGVAVALDALRQKGHWKPPWMKVNK